MSVFQKYLSDLMFVDVLGFLYWLAKWTIYFLPNSVSENEIIVLTPIKYKEKKISRKHTRPLVVKSFSHFYSKKLD